MANISVTITTLASGPFNVAQLFAGNTYANAVSILPASPVKPPSKPNYLSVQADPANGGANVIVGDKNILNTGTTAGKKLQAGTTDVQQGSSTPALAQRWVTADTSGAIVHIEASGGFQ